jgi:hypothetical protein
MLHARIRDGMGWICHPFFFAAEHGGRKFAGTNFSINNAETRERGDKEMSND